MPISKKPDDNATVRRLIDQINRRMPELEADKLYQLEDILDPEYWVNMEDSPKVLGRRFSTLVRNGRVPFSSEPLTKDRHNHYRYTP